LRIYDRIAFADRLLVIAGLYFAGTVAHGRDWRKAAGGFIHGFRYTAQALFHVLEARQHGMTWPSEEMPFDVGRALGMARSRINEASSLYQMFGELNHCSSPIVLA